MSASQEGPKRNVYESLRDISEQAMPHVAKLFVLAGENGMSDGFFFEKISADHLHGTALTGELPTVGSRLADLPEGDVEKLWELREGLLGRLRDEGMDAAREFYVAGRSMDGQTSSHEDIARAIQAIISRIDS